MMIGFNGGLIGKARNPLIADSIPGVWSLAEQCKAVQTGSWTGLDPFGSNVTLLLRGNGGNGTTTFTDDSSYAFMVISVGNAVISTDQSRFGDSSMYFDGNGDYLSINYSNAFDFDSGDFTVEMWVRRRGNSTGGAGTIYEAILGSNASSTPRWTIYLNRNTKNIIWFGNDSVLRETSGITISNDTWYHIAWSRAGTTLRGFINGTQVYSATTSTSFTTSSSGLRVAYDQDANRQFYGYIDDLRITKGVCRYTANFTPPGAL